MDPVEPFGFLSPGPYAEGHPNLFGFQLRPAHVVEDDGRFYDPGFAPLCRHQAQGVLVGHPGEGLVPPDRQVGSANLLMQAFGRNQILFMPRTGDVVSAELATGNGPFPSIAPLPSNLPRKRDR